ncbi:MAG: DMT family transporter [Pseudomonadota bacterium]
MSRPSLLSGTEIDRPAMAAGLMLFALFTLGLQDALVRLASDGTSIWLFQLLRSTGNMVLILVVIVWLMGVRLVRPVRLWAVAARAACLVTAMVFFFGGVAHLTLAEMAAGLYTFPIFVTVLSALVLGERVGWRRVLAVGVGATGAALILQPGSADFSAIKLLPVVAGLCYAGVVILTRRWCREESPVTLAIGVAIGLWSAGAIGVAVLETAPLPTAVEDALPYLARGWVLPSQTVIVLALVCSVLNLAANITLAKAYQSAEASWLAPIDYSYLIFATFWGWAIFGDLPDIWMALGMGLIASAGIFTGLRERRLRAATSRDR